MARVASLLVALCVFLLCNLRLCTTKAVVQALTCKLPNSTVKWEPNPESKVVDVHWKIGIEHTCYSADTCYGRPEVIQDGVNTTSVPVQLHPVQLQNGTILRFNNATASKRHRVYKVNSTAFLHCHHSMGRLVLRDNGTGFYKVLPQFLDVGNNYFVVATEHKGFPFCDLGLRLNVTVKSENCTGNETGVCGGRGICATNRHHDNFACYCCGTYKGHNCSVSDTCLSRPCQNGGVCRLGNSSAQNYTCECGIGYHGEHCEHRSQSLCDVIKCHNNGTCTGNATSFNCTCAPGWTGSQCEVDIDDCQSWPCRHGHCMDRLNGYNCSCYPGYFGDNCEYQRKGCTFSPCKNGGYCENRTTSLGFGFACHCPPGWNGTDCTQKISPCTPNPCTTRGFCMEEYNSFKCVCQPGFTGHRCEVNINDCEPNPCLQGGHCMDLEQGHLCRCVQTHYGGNCQNTISNQGYSPALDAIVTNVVVVHDKDGANIMPVVAGVLTAGVLILIVVLVGCYFRTVENGRELWCLRGLLDKKINSGLTVQVTTPAAHPLTSDAFFQGSRSTLDLGINNKAYESELV